MLSNLASFARFGWPVCVLFLAFGAGPGTADQAAASNEGMSGMGIAPGVSTQKQCWARYQAQAAVSAHDQIEEVAFRVPCAEQITHGLIVNMQRALKIRGLYHGQVTGQVDQATRQALQAFQRSLGFDSPILTLEAARALGLLSIEIAGK